MDWSYFIYFAAPALLCWIGGAWLAYRPSFSKGAVAWTVFGLVIFSAFIVGMWISLERPPLRFRMFPSPFARLFGMVSAPFANEQYRNQQRKATQKRNSYQKVIICSIGATLPYLCLVQNKHSTRSG